MGITLPVIGQTSWGDENNACFEQLQDGGLIPNDAGFLSWNSSPQRIVGASGAVVSGTVKMARLPKFTQAKSVTSVCFHIAAAAITPTAGQCFAGIYRMDGTRVAVTADISGSLGVTGIITYALSGGPVALAAGEYYAALLQNAATPATLGQLSSLGVASVLNAGLTAATAFHTDGPTAQTSLPASVTMASRTLSTHPAWAGVK